MFAGGHFQIKRYDGTQSVGEVGEVILKAPFPWFGGKSRVAPLVWDHFGWVPNFVEPFFGSGAVLLGRPHEPKTETVNDLDAFVSNWWRAVADVPEETAEWADWPVNEADMLARHKALIADTEFRVRIRTEPDYYDAKVAGWWAWGLNIWIGDGWCRHEAEQLPHLGDPGKGINRRLPHLGDPGKGRREKIIDWFSALAERMRDVRSMLRGVGSGARGIGHNEARIDGSIP